MLQRSDRQLLLITSDFVWAGAAFLASIRVRFGADFVAVWEQTLELPSVLLTAGGLASAVVAVYWAAGAYRTERFWSSTAELMTIVKALAFAALGLMSMLYFFRLEDFSRLTLAGFLVVTLACTAGSRVVLNRLASARNRGSHVVIVGTHGIERILEKLARLPDGAAVIVGVLDGDAPDIEGLEWLGPVSSLPMVLTDRVVDEVVVCLPIEEWSRLDAIAGVCEEQGKVMRVPVDVVRYSLGRGHIEDLDTVPMLSLVSSPSGHLALVAKRAFDLVISAVLLVLLAPVHAIVLVVLMVIQGRPLFYRQLRGGLNGRPFVVLKFRTMIDGAEAQQSELLELNERKGPAFKLTNDPRITPFGRFLRKTSIDELPQLWNVLTGDMSLVGPRPQPISEVAEYDPWHRRRLTVKPGITGLWQVTSRNDPSFDNWVDLDLYYIDRWSVWLDFKILAMTPMALIRSPGH